MRERRYGGDARFRSPPPPPRMRNLDREYSSRRHELKEERYPLDYDRSRKAEDDSRSTGMRASTGEYNRRFYDEGKRDRNQLKRISDFSEGLFHGHTSKYNSYLDSGDRNRGGDKDGQLGRSHQYGYVLWDKDSSQYNLQCDAGDRDEYRDRDGQDRRLSRYNKRVSHGDSTSMNFHWNNLYSKPTKLSGDVGYNPKYFTDDSGVTATRVCTERAYYGGSANLSRSMLDNPISVEADRENFYPSYPLEDGISRILGHVDVSSSGNVDGNFSLSSANLRTGLYKDEGFQFRNETQLDRLSSHKPLARELYEEENHFLHKKDASDHIVPFSQYNDYAPFSSSGLKDMSPILRERHSGSADGSRAFIRPVDYDVYGQRLHMKSPPYIEMQLSDVRSSYSQPYCSPRGGKYGDYTNPEVQRSERGDLDTTDEFYGRMGRFQEEYGQHNLLQTSTLDPIADRSDEDSHRDLVGDSNAWDPYTISKGQTGSFLDEKYCNPRGGKYGDYTYPEVQRIERGDLDTTHEFYGRMERFQEEYREHNLLQTNTLDPIADRSDEDSHRDLVGDSNAWDPYTSSKGQISSFLYGIKSSLPEKTEEEVLGCRNGQLEYERKEYQDQVKLHLGEGHSWPDTKLEMLPLSKYDSRIYNISQERLNVGKLSLHESSSKSKKRKHSLDKKLSKYNSGSILLSKVKPSHKLHFKGEGGERWEREVMEPLHLSMKSKFRYGKRGRISSNQGISDSICVSLSKPRHLCEPHNSNKRDIKKRLGPAPQNTQVSRPKSKKAKLSLKKRLGPASQTTQARLLWLKSPKSCKQKKKLDCSEGSLLDEGEDTVESNAISKTEPPEKSEDFKHLVNSAFFKFVKKLNDCAIRLLDPEKDGGLKCCVCGSDSEEFVSVESLALHAFTSKMIGLRSQHLGFHKALCAQMGWESSAVPDGTWVCLTLSDTETRSLKDDLIVWPPVVIIHNKSLISTNPDERVIVSIQKLEVILRDIGVGDKAKVVRGGPANQSVMMVRFNSTFSGLQEAERLHKFYAEAKHGRADLQQVNSSNDNCEETQKSSLDKVKSVLYGYLAVAEDLDKLDFETKKRCLVKSKKELVEIAHAYIKN